MSDQDFRAQIIRAMAQLTAARAAQLVDACTVTRPAAPGPTPVLDGDGNPVVPPPTTVYIGPCAFGQLSNTEVQPETTNDQSGVPVDTVLRVPHGTGLRPGDQVTATAATFMPSLTGDRFVVVRQAEKTYATSERYFLRGTSWLA